MRATEEKTMADDAAVVLTMTTPDLFARRASFPPYVWELKERDYPNRLLAVSNNPDAIRAAIRVWYLDRQVKWWQPE
jgi:hypothetical protein